MELGYILKNYNVRERNFVFCSKSYKFTEAVCEYKGNQCMKYCIFNLAQDRDLDEIDWADEQTFNDFQIK